MSVRASDMTEWPWPESTDATVAAPASHRVLHTHQADSVMIIDEMARNHYYAGATLEAESPPDLVPGMRVLWMEPEGPHSVENIDGHRFHAIRVELK